jgi:hypothetical protein
MECSFVFVLPPGGLLDLPLGGLLVLPPGGLSKGRRGPLVVPPTIEGLFYFFNALNYAAISFLIALLWDVG